MSDFKMFLFYMEVYIYIYIWEYTWEVYKLTAAGEEVAWACLHSEYHKTRTCYNMNGCPGGRYSYTAMIVQNLFSNEKLYTRSSYS